MEDQFDRMGEPDRVSGERPPSGFIRKTGVAMAGGVVTAAGIVMLVTPGPGVLVTLAGLSILGREFPAIQQRIQRFRRTRGDTSGNTDGDS